MDTIAEVRAVVRALQTANVDFALCGGIAMAVHGLPRLTKDIDHLADIERLGFDIDDPTIQPD